MGKSKHFVSREQTHFWIVIIIILLATNFGSTDFSEKYFVVHFNPFISVYDNKIPDMYNETELIFMVTQISTRFKRLAVTITKETRRKTSSYTMIPAAVAKFNKFLNPPGQPPLELIIIYYDPDQFATLESQLTLAPVKLKADEANRIFPGTVKIIVLELLEAEKALNIIISQINAMSSILNPNSSQPEYKLGTLLSSGYCNSTEPLAWNAIARIASHVDFIIFARSPSNTELSDGVTPSLLNFFQNFFEGCKANLSAEVGVAGGIEMGFLTRWPDTIRTQTGEINKRNTSMLVSFWESMNTWAERSSTTVLLIQAFDVPSSTTGWWSLVENSSYDSALDYVFEEKRLEGDSPKQNVSTGVESLLQYFPNDTYSFNVANLGVTFDPAVSEIRTESYSATDLVPLVQLVAAEFRKIAVEINPRANFYRTMLNVSLAASQFNKANRHSLPLQVVMILHCAYITTDNDMAALAQFDLIHKLANEANSVFPNTVVTLIITSGFNILDPEFLPNVLKSLATMKRQIKMAAAMESDPEYIFGVMVSIDECLKSRYNLQPNLTQILKIVEVIIFRVYGPSHLDINLTADIFLGRNFGIMKFCKEAILRAGVNVEIQFMMEWPDTIPPGHQNLAHLVEFWGKVKGWSMDKNTTVFIREAFDTPLKAPTTRGWWRLTEETLRRNASDYKFEDKLSVLLKMAGITRGESKNSSGKGSEDGGIGSGGLGLILGYVGVGILTVIGFVSCGIGVVYAKFAKRKTGLELQPGMDIPPNTVCNKELEVALQEFSIDENVILGSGEFGIVYKAKVVRSEVDLDVAAKTTKHLTVVEMKGILAEIKILGYVGPHENIVSIVGAYTAELLQGKVYIFTELCSLGSLKNVLREMKPIRIRIHAPVAAVPLELEDDYVDHSGFEESDSDYDEVVLVAADNGTSNVHNTLDFATISELLKWSHEICTGMEFLTSKHVVHADLASRNVLLTEARTAKISDFGLSRRMYAYESYVKSQRDALPWRWMAPESLRKLEFNEKTDVWAFGVTLWEVFSLADVPFGGMSWSGDFINRLEKGLRLGKPRYDNLDLYCLMLQCWNVEGSERPQFSDLKVWLTNVALGRTTLGDADMEAEACL